MIHCTLKPEKWVHLCENEEASPEIQMPKLETLKWLSIKTCEDKMHTERRKCFVLYL